MIKRRAFSSLKEANKAYNYLSKVMLKLSAYNGSPAEVDIVYFFDTKQYYVLFGYEMDYDNSKCVLDYSCQGIEWEFLSLM